jgi:serpin B
MKVLVHGNSVFAFDLYRALLGDQENLFFSPFSISQALAMTYAGAQNDTEAQMAGTLHYRLPQKELHETFYALDQMLTGRETGAKSRDGVGFRLNIANALWGQEGYGFLPEYLALLEESYGAGMRWLDFAADAEAARVTINDWVSDQTEGRILDLIPPGILNSATRLVLTNAIYFNAAWAYPFNEQLTEDAAFILLDGSEVMVPTMLQTESLGYAEGQGYQAVELPYDGGQLSMVLLLPDAGEFAGFEASLNGEQVAGIVQDLERAQVTLTLPKFEFESEFSLASVLARMGMPAAFSSDADFSAMTGARDLSIDAVLHKAFVAVDEEGTEAAAATAVVMAETASLIEDLIEVRVDRPFLFLIRDIETGAILFVGRVVDPR